MATRRTFALLGIAVAMLLLFGCASDAEPGANAGGTSTTAATGPAPGVTDDSIKIGITYVDTGALAKNGLDYDLGDHQAVYTALIDDINADGGINGRKLEAVFAPIDPTSTQPAEAACLKLAEDDDVFIVTGFFLADAVLCPVAAHETAVVGGEMTPERLAQAKAPWLTWTPDTDQPEQVVKAFADAGELDGKVAVFSDARDSELLENTVLPALEAAGVEEVATGLVDAPADDTAAIDADVQLASERFQTSGADTVLLVGPSGANWPTALEDDPSYRPKLLFLELRAAHSFATNGETQDLSILDGSLAGGSYGPDQARFDELGMQACVDILDEAGLDTSPPSASTDPSDQPYQSAFQACADIALLKAWVTAAGQDLNYGTLGAAIDGLEATIPGDPTPRTYGPPPAADGNPTAYLFAWNPTTKDFAVEEG